ncbi:MAG: 2-oxoglutarate and iron-dependent oxygenase domain-containing protein [Alphaproteobacteria bacterium]
MADIPVIDLTPVGAGGADAAHVARRIDEVCRDLGFLVLTGHGVPAAVIDRCRQTARAFFDLPLDRKLAVRSADPAYPYGYLPVAVEGLAQSLGKVTPGDLKESLSIGPFDATPADAPRHAAAAYFFAPNLWPAAPPDLRAAWTDYFDHLLALAHRLVDLFALALELPPESFRPAFRRPLSSLRAINYPALDAPPEPGQLRAGEHTDYGMLTILLAEDVPGGLQVRRPGVADNAPDAWIDVAPPAVANADAFIVNIGDLLARWTNDRWVSTLHRVAVPPPDAAGDTRRQSLVFFHNTDWDARIACLPTCLAPGEVPLYPPISADEHRRVKYQRTLAMANAAPDQSWGGQS